jgi:hypothetical protein
MSALFWRARRDSGGERGPTFPKGEFAIGLSSKTFLKPLKQQYAISLPRGSFGSGLMRLNKS